MKNKVLAKIDKTRGGVKRPYNAFVESLSKEQAREELSQLVTHERVYLWLANGRVRRIDGNRKKVWLDWRLNYKGAYMMHNHIYEWDTLLSPYDIREADELELIATEMVNGDTTDVYRPLGLCLFMFL